MANGDKLLERHETFKERCKQAGLEIMKKWKKKKKKRQVQEEKEDQADAKDRGVGRGCQDPE